MNLLNNKLFITGLVLVLVVGLLATAQLIDNSSPTGTDGGGITESPIDLIKKAVKNMSQSNWDKTVYYLIKNNIDDYHKSKQVDDNEYKSLNDLLLKSYLLKLTETTVDFCKKSGDMNIWSDLYTETAKFSSNSDMNKAIGLLNDYRNIRNTALAAENYGNNEKYDATKSKNFESIINNFNNNDILKNNPTLLNEVNSALVALGRVSGLNNKFNKTDFENCNCNSDFGRNEYYKNACLEKQKNI